MPKRATIVACLLSLTLLPIQGHSQSGIAADLAAAHSRGDSAPAETAMGEDTTDLEQRAADLRSGITRKTRSLYRLTRAGMAPITGGIDAVRGHVARVARLKRLLHSDLSSLAQTERALVGLRSQRAQPATDEARGAHEPTAPAFEPLRLAASEPETNAPAGAGFYGLRMHDGSSTGESFASLRGRLSSPVTGEVIVEDAHREESDGAGLEFRVRPGTAVRAVATGRVAFSDVYGSYGRLVILDHGEGYYTVYGGLGSVEVRVGDDLSQRARIGSVGDDDGQSALYFEVRKGTRAQPPRAWIGL